MTATGRVSVSHDRTSQMSSPTSAEMRPTVLRIAIASGAANTWRRLSRPRRDEPLMAILFRREAGFRPLQLFDFHLDGGAPARQDRKSTRLNSSHSQISYAVFCLKKKK